MYEKVEPPRASKALRTVTDTYQPMDQIIFFIHIAVQEANKPTKRYVWECGYVPYVWHR